MKALDTSHGSSLGSIDNIEQSIERFVFTLPNSENITALEIEFFNDTWAGEGRSGDRNLYVIGVSLSVVNSHSEAECEERRLRPFLIPAD